jgi:hypothetical protein
LRIDERILSVVEPESLASLTQFLNRRYHPLKKIQENAMSSVSVKQPTVPGRCDLCGRVSPRMKAYRLYSRVIPLPAKKVSLEPTGVSSLTSETQLKAHDFSVCSRCHDRKTIFLIISAVMLAGWIWLALRSDSPLFPLLGFFAILGFAATSGRDLPVQRLVRHIKRERRAAMASVAPGLNFRIEALTQSAFQMHDRNPAGLGGAKWCESCKRGVPISSKVGDRCPHCGVVWEREIKR